MELITLLETVLMPQFLQRPKTPSGVVTLRDHQSKMEVELIGVSTPFLAIRMSKLMHMRALRDHPDVKKICDYLLIGQSDDSDYVIFIELKDKLREKDDPKEQLRRSLPVLKYLLSVCEIEAEHDFNDWKSDLTLRYVLIAEQSSGRLDRQGVRISPKGEQEIYRSIPITTFAETPFLSISDMLPSETAS